MGRIRTIRPDGDREAGFTLMELLVSMTVMGIFMAMFAGSVKQIFDSANRVEGTTISQTQVNGAFLRLDTDIRYASGLSTPGSVGSNPYVEWLSTASGTAICTELRLDTTTNQLQRRTWNQGASPLVPTAWNVLATGVTSAIFTVTATDATYTYQRIRLQLTTSYGSGSTVRTRSSDVTFGALNTTSLTASTTTCTEGRAVA